MKNPGSFTKSLFLRAPRDFRLPRREPHVPWRHGHGRKLRRDGCPSVEFLLKTFFVTKAGPKNKRYLSYLSIYIYVCVCIIYQNKRYLTFNICIIYIYIYHYRYHYRYIIYIYRYIYNLTFIIDITFIISHGYYIFFESHNLIS